MTKKCKSLQASQASGEEEAQDEVVANFNHREFFDDTVGEMDDHNEEFQADSDDD